MQRAARYNAGKIQIFWTGAISRDNASLCAPPEVDDKREGGYPRMRVTRQLRKPCLPFALLRFALRIMTIIAELQGSLSSLERPQDAR